MARHKGIVITLLLALVSNLVDAQTHKEVRVSNSIEMTSKMNEVWSVISNLANLDVLVPEIITKTETIGSGKGAVVTLTLKSNGLKIVEKVTELDNHEHVMVYEMIETPMPIRDYKATIRIVAANSTSYKINFNAVFKVQEENKQKMETAIGNFQKMLLANIKKTYNYEE